MANSEESQMISQRLLQFQERSKGFGKPASTARRLGGTGLWSHFLSQEWSSALLYLFLDVVSWLAIYRVAGWFRFDAFYATPFQFFIINIIQLGVIVAALYFVGGYDRNCREADPRLCGRTHSCHHRSGRGQCDADLFRGDVRSDDEA